MKKQTSAEEKRNLQTAEDELLVSRFKAGEDEAFDRLMALHMDQVFGLAWSVLHDREAALDAAQEVFIKLYSAIPKFGDASNLSAWLYRVCLNYCIDVKRRKRNVECEMTDEEWNQLQGAQADDPSTVVQSGELRNAIYKAVESLPPRQQAAFVLRHYQYMSLKEIAETMGCSVGAVKAHLARAAANLKTKLGGYIGAAEEVLQNESL